MKIASPTQLDGYKAASASIDEHLADSFKKVKNRKGPKNTKSPDYREGYFDGLLFASCQMAMGEFPKMNKIEITRLLRKKKP